MTSLEVTGAGPSTTVQAGRRVGYRRFGVPPSGPIDRIAHAAANHSLGNPLESAAVEITGSGLELRCDGGPLTVALTGGDVTSMVDGRASYRGWVVRTLRDGQTLRAHPGPSGRWSYVAVAGQLRVTPWLGSASTHAPSGFGGGALAEGDSLVVDDAVELSGRDGPLPQPPSGIEDNTARVVRGPQAGRFDEETIGLLGAATFTVTSAVDRMGLRLDGPPLPPCEGLSLPSEPAQRGALQISGDGVATVLLADHQTTGGYPKIATLLTSDLNSVAQLSAGAELALREVSAREAIEAERVRARQIERYLAEVAQGTLPQRLRTHNLIGGAASAWAPTRSISDTSEEW